MTLRYTTLKVVIDDPDLSDQVRVDVEAIKDGRWKAHLRSGIPALDSDKTFDAFSPVLKAWASRALQLGAQARSVDDATRDQHRRLRAALDRPIDLDQEHTRG